MAICNKCGEALQIGAWPFCPHGAIDRLAVHGDEIDYIDHNLGRNPVHIRSKEQRERLMKKHELVEAPWSPGSNTTNWAAAPDDYTLRYKGELLERAMTGQQHEEDGKILDLDIHYMDDEELRKYGCLS